MSPLGAKGVSSLWKELLPPILTQLEAGPLAVDEALLEAGEWARPQLRAAQGFVQRNEQLSVYPKDSGEKALGWGRAGARVGTGCEAGACTGGGQPFALRRLLTWGAWH